MATNSHRCDLCSSEILGTRPGSAPHICVLCRLSAEGAFEAWRPVSGREASDVIENLVRLVGA